MIADDRTRRLLLDLLHALGRVRKSARRILTASKIEPVALDLFLLAIHEIDVIAQEQAQILDPGARMLEADRIEAEQQVVTKCTDQREPVRQRSMELGHQSAQ